MDKVKISENKNTRLFPNILSFLVIFGLLVAICVPVYAGDPVRKLGRGIANIATGWMEFPKEIFKETEEKGEVSAIFIAPLKGMVKTIGRTLVGIYDATTFFIPLPRRYEPIIEPELVVSRDE